MNRRALLSTLAASAVAVPGCLSDSDAGDPSATPTRSATETAPAATDGGTPTARTDTRTASGPLVAEVFAVPQLAAPNSPDSFGVYGARGEQFVVALLDGAAAGRPPADDVALVADGTAYDAKTDIGYGSWALFDYDGAYDPADAPSGWVVFRLPKPLDAPDAAITWHGGRHPLGDDALAELARPPTTFAVRAFDAPDAVPAGETFTLSLTVENAGGVDGTFVGAVNRNFPAYAPVASIRLPVAAGERATWERTVETTWSADDRGGELRLWLYWRNDEADRAVTVTVGSGSPTGTDTPTATETQPITPTPEPTE